MLRISNDAAEDILKAETEKLREKEEKLRKTEEKLIEKEEKLSDAKGKLRDTENELEDVLTRLERKDKEYLDEKQERNEREKMLIEREKKVRQEMDILSSLHKKMSEELNGSIQGESFALALLKQREVLSERERWDADGLVRMLKRDLQSAHTELERERERSKNYSLLSRTYYPLSAVRPSYRDIEEDDEARRMHMKEIALYGHGQQTSPRASQYNLGGSFLTASSSPPKGSGSGSGLGSPPLKGSPKGSFAAGLSNVSDRGLDRGVGLGVSPVRSTPTHSR